MPEIPYLAEQGGLGIGRAALTFSPLPTRRLLIGARQVLLQPVRPLQHWSIDFMSDAPSWGRPYRLLNVIDDYARGALGIEIDFSLGSERVRRVLEIVRYSRGGPQ